VTSGFADALGFSKLAVNDATPGPVANKSRKNARHDGKENKGGLFDLSEYREIKDNVFGAWLVKLTRKHKKPLITITFYPEMIPVFLKELDLLCYDTPEKGVRSLAKLCAYGAFLKAYSTIEKTAGNFTKTDELSI
jgi:hypothetical protein